VFCVGKRGLLINICLICIIQSICGYYGESVEGACLRFVCNDKITVKAEFHEKVEEGGCTYIPMIPDYQKVLYCVRGEA
jgi:hypothetical protein